jgi:formate hydrogenlyase subunit 6/NADH:ubiquinone oxidoreductase subunit I
MNRFPDLPASPSRRRFLRLHSGTPIARIGSNCLALRRVECRVCFEHCPHGAIELRVAAQAPARPVIIAGRCTRCGDCVATCPTGSIHIRTTEVNV